MIFKEARCSFKWLIFIVKRYCGMQYCSSASMKKRTEAKNAKGAKDVGDDSRQSDYTKEQLEESSAAKKIVTAVLKSDGQLGEKGKPSLYSSELPCSSDANPSQPCKVCKYLGDLSKMHICDFCENAFHLSCCMEAAWFCSPYCLINKPEPSTGGSMVRISSKFQADIPSQCGADSSDEDYFGGMAPTNFTGLDEWNFKKVNSVGNWIQCLGYKTKDKKNEKDNQGCGKWRRAPLSIEQPEEWDCSAAVTWDQLHADCAVPQELPTSEVEKQLKFMEQVKSLVAAGSMEEITETWHHE